MKREVYFKNKNSSTIFGDLPANSIKWIWQYSIPKKQHEFVFRWIINLCHFVLKIVNATYNITDSIKSKCVHSTAIISPNYVPFACRFCVCISLSSFRLFQQFNCRKRHAIFFLLQLKYIKQKKEKKIRWREKAWPKKVSSIQIIATHARTHKTNWNLN